MFACTFKVSGQSVHDKHIFTVIYLIKILTFLFLLLFWTHKYFWINRYKLMYWFQFTYLIKFGIKDSPAAEYIFNTATSFLLKIQFTGENSEL